ncbi:MAG: hypothetical protein PVG39_03460, partial [Desulfobacteraceae bacterium]
LVINDKVICSRDWFDSLIRQFKPIPATDNLIVYNQDRKLLCSDMDGNILWQIENLIIHSNILISQKGYTGYFILNPNDLLQFNVNGESFFEICDERMIKFFSASWDGNTLLVLDSENELVMFDKNAQRLWEYNFENKINHIRLSPKGDFFFTVDNDDVLCGYSVDSSDKNREDFFEISDDKRILEKEAIWTIRPGGYNRAASLSELTISPDGTLFGLTGLDGCIYFYDEQGRTKYQTSFTSTVKDMRISDSSRYGYIFGGNEISLVDFQDDKKKFILFEKKILGNPIVNYHQKKIFTISREKELLIYNYEGRLINTVPLNKEYKKGISCETHGIVLFSEREITGFSGEGKSFFNYPLESKIVDIFYNEPLLICSDSKHSVIKMDLSILKVKRKSLKVKEGGVGIFSVDPLFIVTGDKSLYHLDSDLSIISACDIESPDSHFFLDEDRLYEIIKKYNGFYCCNDKREMIWRYSSEERILESALMHNGLVFCTEDSVRYLEIRKKEESKGQLSQYLEI